MTVVGFDGWRGGWVGVRLTRGSFSDGVIGPTLADLLHAADIAVGIDMPLSFALGGEARPFDVAARARLGRRASTLFLVPPEDVMRSATYQDANRLSKARYGRGISAQAYALRDKIFEAIDLGDERLVEIHPELAFADLAGEVLMEPKRTWAGQHRRLRLLSEAGVTLPADVGEAGRVPPDDLIDAAAVALAAWRLTSAAVP